MKSIICWRRRFLPALVVFFMLIIGVFMLSSCEQFGANPSGAYLSDIEASSNYDAQEAQFVNEETNVLSGIGDDINFFGTIPLGAIRQIFFLTPTKPHQTHLCQKFKIPIC